MGGRQCCQRCAAALLRKGGGASTRRTTAVLSKKGESAPMGGRSCCQHTSPEDVFATMLVQCNNFFATIVLWFCYNTTAVFGCTELGLVLNLQWKTRFPNSMEYHKECLDARGIKL